MAMNVKDFKNVIQLSGAVENYFISKDPKAKRLFDGGDRFKKGDTYTSYTGYIDVRTSPDDIVRVNIQSEFTLKKDGDPTAQTEALEAMSNKEVPKFKTTNNLLETPLISFFGDYQGVPSFKFNDNYYVAKDGSVVEGIRVDLGFAKLSLKEPSKTGDYSDGKEFKNVFVVSGVITKIDEELVKDEETGRVKVKVQVPYSYGSEERNNFVVRAMPMDLIAGMSSDDEGEFDMAELIVEEDEENGVVDFSWEINGHIHGFVETTESAKPTETGGRRLGRGRQTINTNVKSTYKQEFMIDGIDILGEDGDLFDLDDLREAVNARLVDIENKKKKAEANVSAEATPTRSSRINRGGDSNSDSSTGTRSTGRKRGWN